MPKKETNLNKFKDYFKLPNPGLRSYFDSVRRGQPDEFRTPFYKGESLEKVLNSWMEHLEPLKHEWPSLFEFESDLAKKVGPMSIMKPLKERMSDIDSYYDSILPESKPIEGEAISRTLKEFSKIRGLRIRATGSTVDNMKKSTNSGSPYFTKRKLVTVDTLPAVIEIDGRDVLMDQSDDPLWRGAAVLGWRGQEGGPKPSDVKQRVVWMFPYAVNIAELQLYQPLIESCQHHNLVPAWVSMDAVDRRVTDLFDSSEDNWIICTDFSKFDQHFNHDMQDAAYQLLKGLMTPNYPGDWWLKNVFPVKYMIPLAYDYGKIRFGKHGMGSGSGGTNADETLAHRALQHESAFLIGRILNPNSQCLGDDGVLSYPGITVEDVMRSYTAHGQEMNEDKQYVSKQDLTYLRRWHHRNYRVNGVCVGVYSTCRALGRLAEQERYYDPEKWGAKMVALRQLSILENVKYHPLREEFVSFCMKGDRYRLGIDIPGFLDNIDKEAKEATDLMPDFLGYTKSQMKGAETGISNWWIVNYLKSKM